MLISMTGLWILWGVLTALLLSLIAYRSVVGTKEDDQLFLNSDNPTEARLQAEHEATLNRVGKLSAYIKVLWMMSGAVLLVIAGIWIYRGILGVVHPTLEP